MVRERGVERQGVAAGRRRRSYTVERKRELVEATMQPGASVSVVAQRHDVNANLLFTWRRRMREGQLEASGATPVAPTQFIPLGVVGAGVDEDASADAIARVTEPAAGGPIARSERIRPHRGHCRIEIELPNGVRLWVQDAVEARMLRQVVAALKEAW
jgi:transposase